MSYIRYVKLTFIHDLYANLSTASWRNTWLRGSPTHYLNKRPPWHRPPSFTHFEVTCQSVCPWLVYAISLHAKIRQTYDYSGAGGTGSAGAGAFASPIPWRKAGLKYNSNDIYFDVVEELKAVVNRWASFLYSKAVAHAGVGVELRYLALYGAKSRRMPSCQVCSVTTPSVRRSLSMIIGTPDLLLTFTNPNTLTDCSFHPCVRYVVQIFLAYSF